MERPEPWSWEDGHSRKRQHLLGPGPAGRVHLCASPPNSTCPDFTPAARNCPQGSIYTTAIGKRYIPRFHCLFLRGGGGTRFLALRL